MRKWKTGQEDVTILRELLTMERGLVAVKHRLTQEALDQRLHRIKRRFRHYEWYVREIKVIKARSSKLFDSFEATPEYNPFEEKER